MGGKLKEYVSVAEEAAAMMLNLANDTIDLYKIRKGKFNIKEKEFEVGEVERKIHKLFEFSFKQKKIEWRANIDEDIRDVLFIGDSSRI